MLKKLIYFTLGNNINYVKLAKLCIDSLNKIGYDGDILFITDLIEDIKNNIEFKKDPFFLSFGNSDLFFSSANKLKIYKFPEIDKFDKIIYCDLDVLWLKDFSILFDSINEDKIYISEEPLSMNLGFFSENLLTEKEEEEIYSNNINGLNAGFFGFNKNMIFHFENIFNFLNENIHLKGSCLEQPYLNMYLYRNKIYDTSFNNYISHQGYHIDSFDGNVLHFPGGPGNFDMKYDKMNNFLNINSK